MTNISPDAAPLPARRRTTLMLTIWTESSLSTQPIWRGVVETGDGRRHYFHTAAGLLQVVARESGWLSDDQVSE